jgi:protein ImuB
LLDRLAAKGRALVALHVELVLRENVGHTELRADCIKPAAATLDSRALMRLVHLRLTGMPPEAPVNEARVWADDVAATREQLALFAAKPRRDLRAADEALARLRAELGDDAVVRAVLRDGHLPEASFGWERLVHVPRAQPIPRHVQPLVRRLHARPHVLPPQARQVRDDGWLLSGLEHGAVVRIVGPYIVSGGWWQHELHREYHFAETRRGDCLWVYFDRNRRRWFLHGEVV